MMQQPLEGSPSPDLAILHPGLAPLLRQTRINFSPNEGDCPVRCNRAGSLVVAPSLTGPQADIVALRYGLELAWLTGVEGLSPAAAAVLAAHAAGCLAGILPAAAGRGRLGAICRSLAGDQLDTDKTEDAANWLSVTHAGAAQLTDNDRLHLHELWRLATPTEALLAAGGDDRLSLTEAGRNKYGCAPWPLPHVISFGSCTASSLSAGAFAAAEAARQSLITDALHRAASAALADASDMIASDLLQYFQSEDLAEAVLAASGTDATLVVTGLLAAEHPEQRLTSVLMSPSETGSGVPDAVQGRHFASSAPTGHSVGKGQQIDGLARGPGLLTVALRDAAGAPRSATDISADCEVAVRHATAGGRAVLHAIDGSKTGLTAPGRADLRGLADRHGDRLDIVIDACQARIEPELARWYLQQGFPVLVTGSKFFAAPGFCGAVLFPKARLRRIASHGRLPAGLEPYARLQGGFGSRRCPGLVLRWRAALHEMKAFAQLPGDEVRTRLERLGLAIRASLQRERRVRLVAAPRPESAGWSGQRTVFTFTVRSPHGWMTPAELRPLYQALNEDLSGHEGAESCGQIASRLCQIGQPVELGSPRLGGLRIAVSAGQVVADADQHANLAAVLAKLRLLLRLTDRRWAAGATSGDQSTPDEPALLTG